MVDDLLIKTMNTYYRNNMTETT